MLDPFAGVGTVGRAAAAMGRRFILIEKRADYYAAMRQELAQAGLGNGDAVDFDDLQYRASADFGDDDAKLGGC